MPSQGTNPIIDYVVAQNHPSAEVYPVDAHCVPQNVPCVIAYNAAHVAKYISFITARDVSFLSNKKMIAQLEATVSGMLVPGKITLQKTDGQLVFVYTKLLANAFGCRHSKENLTKLVNSGLETLMMAVDRCEERIELYERMMVPCQLPDHTTDVSV